MYSRGRHHVAKSKKDKPADTDPAEALTPDTPDAKDTLPEPAGEDSVTAEPETPEPETTEPAAADPAEVDDPASEDTIPAEPEEGAELDQAIGSLDPSDTDTMSVADDTMGEHPAEERADIEDLPEPEPVLQDDTLAAAAPARQVIKETVIQKKAGFVPTLLGGVVAAGIGFVAGSYPNLPFMGPTEVVEDPFFAETRAALLSQGEQLEKLAKGVSETNDAVAKIDLAPLGSSIATLETGLAGVSGVPAALDGLQADLTGLADKVRALDIRVTSIEKQPLVDAVSPETVAAYERELETLKADVEAQKAAIAAAQADQLATMEAARKEIEAMAARARASEQSAETRATLAASRVALADLTTRARDGQPYGDALALLLENGVDVPAPLVEGAQEGLPTASALISGFPDAARDALAAARASGTGDEDAGGVAGFFRSQLGARSVTPREGDDPDAVLSRAEAALRNGDLATVLTEIEILPEVAQNEMSDWVALARLRRDALVAASDLTQTLNQE